MVGLGEAAAIGSALCWSTSSVLLKVPSRRMRAVYITAFRMCFTALLAVGTAAAAGQLGGVLDMPIRAVLILVASAAVIIAGDVAFFRAFALDDLSRVFTVNTGLYILLSVIASILFARDADAGVVATALFGGNGWKWALLVIGGSLVVLGIALISEPGRGEGDAAGGKARRGMPLEAVILTVFTSVTWTVGLLALNEAMKLTEPLPAAVVRAPTMPLLLLPFIFLNGDVKRYGWGGSQKWALVLSGLLGGGSMLLFMVAVKYTAPGVVAILSSSSPVFVLVMTTFLLRERPTRRALTGTAICMAGIALTV